MNELKKDSKEKLLMRVCHSCTQLNESLVELERCGYCQKSFLPLRYFEKIHSERKEIWKNHFSSSEEIDEEDLIKGLFVLW